jgi:hypothetical protein
MPKPSMKRMLTTHVVTRWYRCPELILLEDYTSAVRGSKRKSERAQAR